MFNFEKLTVYTKSEDVYKKILTHVLSSKIDKDLRDQLKRASSSIILNIAEGAGKFSSNDKKNFYAIARGSTHECVAILRILNLEEKIKADLFQALNNDFNEISRMLSGLINRMVHK